MKPRKGKYTQDGLNHVRKLRKRYYLWGKAQLVASLIPITGFANRMLRFAYDAYGNDMIRQMLPGVLPDLYIYLLSALVFMVGVSIYFRGRYYKNHKEEIDLFEGME